jgi:hypothetical protein
VLKRNCSLHLCIINVKIYRGICIVTPLVRNTYICSDIKPCNLLNVNRCFGADNACLFVNRDEKRMLPETSISSNMKSSVFIIYFIFLLFVPSHPVA